MITANLIIKISENWFKSVKTSMEIVDIYINPTSSDYLELNKRGIRQIRFLADADTREVYIADAMSLTHDQIALKLNKPKVVGAFESHHWNILPGMATVSGNKSTMTFSDQLEGLYRDVESFLKKLPLDKSKINRRKEISLNIFQTGMGSPKNLIDNIITTEWSWCDRYVNVSSWISTYKQKYDALLKKYSDRF